MNDPSCVAASGLCLSCGLCCNGVLFHTVQLQPSDSARELSALGLRIVRRRGRDCFLQPCAALEGNVCTIYAERPERCRRFECRQLRGMRAGRIAEVEAMRKIQEVKERVSRLDELSRRADGSLRKGPLQQRCETALAEPFDAREQPGLRVLRAELARGLAELDAMLEAEFRVESERDESPVE